MTHRAIILTVLCFCLFQANAQMTGDSATTPTPAPHTTHWTLGVQGGYGRNYHQIDMSYMSDMKYDKFTSGSTFGIRATYNPWKWIGIRADVVLIEKNYHMDHVSHLEYRDDIITQTTTNNLYLNVPLLLDFSFGRRVRVHLSGGGYVGYWLSSHRKGKSYSMTYMLYPQEGSVSYNEFDEDVPFNEKRDNRLDAGFAWGGGLSVRIWNELRVSAEARWYYGVLDIQNDYMRNLNPRYNTTFTLQGGVTWSL